MWGSSKSDSYCTIFFFSEADDSICHISGLPLYFGSCRSRRLEENTPHALVVTGPRDDNFFVFKDFDIEFAKNCNEIVIAQLAGGY